ncbi:MAG: DUF3014 domain-containing protein [Pseudomonadales bacterium]
MRYLSTLLIIAGLAAGLYWWYLDSRPLEEQVMELAPVRLLPPKARVEPAAPIEVPAPVLPSLGESDGFVRAMAEGLAQGAIYLNWLRTEELLRRSVALVDSVAGGDLPKQLLPPLALKSEPVVRKHDGLMYLNAASYARYDALVAAIASLDADGLSQIYFVVEPLLDAAFQELGYPGRRFRPRLVAAIDHLLAAPVIDSALELSRPSVVFEFARPELESLPDTYKQLLRMGPEHTRRIQAKLQELRVRLEAGIVAGR